MLIRFILFFIFFNAYSQENNIINDVKTLDFNNWSSIIGLGFEEIIKYNPNEIGFFKDKDLGFPFVFFKENNVFLVFIRNKVWMLRYNKDFKGSISDISIGLNKSNFITNYEKKIIKSNNVELDKQKIFIMDLEDKGYPARIQLFFNDKDILTDIYVYRSDY